MPVPLKLISHKLCPYVQRAVIALTEKGVAFERIGLPTERLLHVAQSLFHDHVPARSLGLDTVWVNRRHGRPGSGATPPASAQPTLEVPDMRTLAELLSPNSGA